jgi:hypothetical protein
MKRIQTIDSHNFVAYYADDSYLYGTVTSTSIFEKKNLLTGVLTTLADWRTILNASGQLMGDTTSVYTHTSLNTDDAIFVTSAIYYTSVIKFTVTSVSLTGNVVITTNSGTTTLAEGTDWNSAVDVNTTAASLAAAINGKVGLSASSVGAVVTVSLNTATRINAASETNAGLTLTTDLGKHWLLGAKKSDPTAWTVICKLGNGSGVHLDDAYILDRGLTKLPTGQYVFGEYVTGSSEGTACRIVSVSSDFSTTTTLVTFNPTSAAEHIKHLHVVAYDSYSNKTWISPGDGDTQAGVIAIDEILTVTWPVDLTPANLITQPGFGGLVGAQRHRTVDIVFTKDWVITGADQSTAGENGIWRFTRDFSIHERVFSSPPTGQNMWTAVMGVDGSIIFSTQRTGVDSPDDYIAFISSDGRDYSTWKTSGLIQLRDNRTSSVAKVVSFFTHNSKIYITQDYIAGCNLKRTAECELGGIFDYNYNQPDPIMPVYFVGADGTNSVALTGDDYRGLTKRLPWATLAYAVTGKVAVHGSLIKIDSSTLSEAESSINLDAFVTTQYGSTDVSQGKPRTVIRGDGATNTIIQNSGANTAVLRNALVDQVIEFQDIRVRNGSPNQNVLWSSSTIITTWILGRGAHIGNTDNASLSRGIYVRDDIVIMEPGSLLEGPSSSAAVGISATTNNTTQYDIRPGAVIKGWRHSILFGFTAGPTGTCTLKVDGATLIGFSQDSASYGAISIVAGATSAMITGIKNCVAKSSTGVAPVVTGGAGVTWDDSKLDYCATDAVCAMAGTYNTHGLTGAALLLDSLGKPSAASPVSQAGDGMNSYGAADYAGNKYHYFQSIPAYARKQSIGAYEASSAKPFIAGIDDFKDVGRLKYRVTKMLAVDV